MSKKVMALLITVTFIIGAAAGAFIHHYYFITKPQNIAAAAAKKQQAELDQMLRHGVVQAVKPNQLTIKVTSAGDKDQEGKPITVDINTNTYVQNGSHTISKPGQAVDLTQYLKAGMKVDVLVKDNIALAVNW